MTEHEARQVLLLQAHEAAEGGRHWSDEDRAWATRQAVAVVGEQAAPERFVVARAALGLQRLLPRDASAQRWLERRAWHPAWVWVGALLGFIAGAVTDQLGAPEHVNLLAPAVWAVVLWNLGVYVSALLPWRAGVGSQLGAWLTRRGRGMDMAASLLWAKHASPLSVKRAALVLHTAAAAFALGLVAGLYLRGLVLDYRAGWQSTFLQAPVVQALLDTLLGPASALTRIVVPEVAPLRLDAGAAAQATAAPWIHLYAATLVLWVVLPRLLLAWWSALRAGSLSRRFPLNLNEPYFEALHPLMRPGLSRVLRLLWVAPPALGPVRLLGHAVTADLAEAVTLLRSEEGDELQLVPAPGAQRAVVISTPPRWWTRWRGPEEPALPAVDAVLMVSAPGQPRPDWVPLHRPVLVLHDAVVSESPALPLRRLADGWLPDGRLMQALTRLLSGDPRLVRLAAAWAAQQQAVLDAGVNEIAHTLARVASTREPVTESVGLLGGGRAEADAAREAARIALLASLDRELVEHRTRLLALLGRPDSDPALAEPAGVPGAAVALRGHVGEGRAAVVGGLLSGAAAGLKADVLSGGLTMGAGAVAGGLLGALGAAGAARGLNVLRGTGRSHVTWDEVAMQAITTALLQRWAVLVTGVSPELALECLTPAVAARDSALAAAWSLRGPTPEAQQKTVAALREPLFEALVQGLGGPAVSLARVVA